MVVKINTHERLNQLLKERGWTRYKLAKESGLSEATIANIFKRGNIPSIATLEMICNGFKITLAQFFAENETIELSPELKELFDGWVFLTPEQKSAVIQLIKVMKND